MKQPDPYHLISTPIPMLPGHKLRSQVGLCGEDPSAQRHQGRRFSVWLTLYSPEGVFVERRKIDELEPGQRKFYDLTELTAAHGFTRPHICVAHRVPDGDLTGLQTHDFDMFRSVVQLVHPGGGRGSVIYETPPYFNGNPKKPGSFLSFSNQIYLADKQNTLLVLLNYSVNADYAVAARRRLLVYAPDGSRVAEDMRAVGPFSVDVTDCAALLRRQGQFSFIACSKEASMVPLIVNLSEKVGGVSIEHTHPPMSYLNMPPERANAVRAQAIEHYLCAKS